MNRTANLRARAAVISCVRRIFDKLDFVEVETPIVVRSPGMDLHLDAFQVMGHLAKREPRYLNTSPEYQMKRLLAEGFPRIFQITKAFRDDELGDQHNPEFTMLEWYRTNAGMHEVMVDTETLLHQVTSGTVRIGERVITVEPPFPRVRVTDAFRRYAGVDEATCLRWASDDETSFYRCLVEHVEPALREEPTPIFLTHYPKEQASLARLSPDDPRFAERFELYCAGLELCNGFSELVDPEEQRERFLADQLARERAGRPVYPIDESLLDALRGLPPCGGNALGLDRLIALACGTTSIRDVIAFPFDVT